MSSASPDFVALVRKALEGIFEVTDVRVENVKVGPDKKTITYDLIFPMNTPIFIEGTIPL